MDGVLRIQAIGAVLAQAAWPHAIMALLLVSFNVLEVT